MLLKAWFKLSLDCVTTPNGLLLKNGFRAPKFARLPVDCADMGWTGDMSKGFVDAVAGLAVSARATLKPMWVLVDTDTEGLFGTEGNSSTGLVTGERPSNRTRASIAFSRLPPTPFSIVSFLRSFVNPSSRNFDNFFCMSPSLSYPKLAPNVCVTFGWRPESGLSGGNCGSKWVDREVSCFFDL